MSVPSKVELKERFLELKKETSRVRRALHELKDLADRHKDDIESMREISQRSMKLEEELHEAKNDLKELEDIQRRVG